jgi:hypothetical protein
MVTSGFRPYHGQRREDDQTKHIDIISTQTMMRALGFIEVHQAHE